MKLLLVCTSGGHFSTMRGLERFWSVHQRLWATDLKDDTRWLQGRQERAHWFKYQGPRNWMVSLVNFPRSFLLILREKPDAIVSTGAGISVNFAIAAKLTGTKFIFVESISRSSALSLSGKLVYYLADEFYVQWPSLEKRYSRARFRGLAA